MLIWMVCFVINMWYLFLIFFITIFLLNSLLVDYFDRITNPEGRKEDIFDNKFRLIFLGLGLFTFLFLKRIRKERKINNYKRRLNHLQLMNNVFGKYNFSSNKEEKKEILKIKRILKLENLK